MHGGVEETRKETEMVGKMAEWACPGHIIVGILLPDDSGVWHYVLSKTMACMPATHCLGSMYMGRRVGLFSYLGSYLMVKVRQLSLYSPDAPLQRAVDFAWVSLDDC